MARLSLFSSPLLLGFEQFESTLERISKMSSDGYPPYNIERFGQDEIKITLAVAGFSKAELSVQLMGNQLMIQGNQTDDKDRVFLHRGIAARQFQRNFVIAEGLDVAGAQLDNGLLHITLVRPSPDANIRVIDID
ncbi:MAG: HSP20 family molecular chaperone IbpA [Alphaproteobacteria bacterium]|jgi:HSP20 family molecular chaperone IbpA